MGGSAGGLHKAEELAGSPCSLIAVLPQARELSAADPLAGSMDGSAGASSKESLTLPSGIGVAGAAWGPAGSTNALSSPPGELTSVWSSKAWPACAPSAWIPGGAGSARKPSGAPATGVAGALASKVHSYHPGSGYQGMAVPGIHLQVLQKLANYLLLGQCHQGMAVPGIHLQVLGNQANYLLLGCICRCCRSWQIIYWWVNAIKGWLCLGFICKF